MVIGTSTLRRIARNKNRILLTAGFFGVAGVLMTAIDRLPNPTTLAALPLIGGAFAIVWIAALPRSLNALDRLGQAFFLRAVLLWLAPGFWDKLNGPAGLDGFEMLGAGATIFSEGLAMGLLYLAVGCVFEAVNSMPRARIRLPRRRTRGFVAAPPSVVWMRVLPLPELQHVYWDDRVTMIRREAGRRRGIVLERGADTHKTLRLELDTVVPERFLRTRTQPSDTGVRRPMTVRSITLEPALGGTILRIEETGGDFSLLDAMDTLLADPLGRQLDRIRMVSLAALEPTPPRGPKTVDARLPELPA